MISAYWYDRKNGCDITDEDIRKNGCDITDEDIRKNVKFAAIELDYFDTRVIPVDNVNAHSLCIGGAMELSLSRYSHNQIQRIGIWKRAFFKECIHGDFAC